jgi:hypothetical protein
VGWRATGGDPVGPYVRNSIRLDVLASLLAKGEAQNSKGADGKRPWGEEVQNANKTSA